MSRKPVVFGGLFALVLVLLIGITFLPGVSGDEGTQPDATAQQQTIDAVVNGYFTQTAQAQQQVNLEVTAQAQFNAHQTATAAFEATATVETARLDFDPDVPLPAGSSNAAWTPVIDDSGPVPLVYVPSGCFMMGSDDGYDDEQPVHEVCLSAFWIGQTEVTNAQYRHCVEAGACDLPGDTEYYDDEAYADHPVVWVSWEDASAYAAWLSEETGQDWGLPTEAQWEYAARGPQAWVYPWGDAFNGDYVVWGGNSYETAPVGSKPEGASWVGAEDLSGNVWEWVADWYDADEYGTLTEGVVNPTGPATGRYRVLRGGSWNHGNTGLFRAAYRGWVNPRGGGDVRGFRCARSR